jgi:formylglycine-generating enzyme required for sulfatase activity
MGKEKYAVIINIFLLLLMAACSKPVTDISLDTSDIHMVLGDTAKLTATIIPENATKKKVIWKSDDENIAAIDEDGVVTPRTAGTTLISVTSVSGKKTAQCAVTVSIYNMVWIEGGTFNMGSPKTEAERSNDEIQHEVTVSGFYMGKYLITQAQYETVTGNNPSRLFKGQPDNPVEQVNWYYAVVFCNKLSLTEGLEPVYSLQGSTDPDTWGAIPRNRNSTWDAVIMNMEANGYRLPTEAEWEYACRAGTTTPFNTGDNITTDQANYNGQPYRNNPRGTRRGKTTEVGSFEPNDWGLYDMHGNVYEWCWDRLGKYPTEEQKDPTGAATGNARVERGGCWGGYAGSLRSAARYGDPPNAQDSQLGIRLVRRKWHGKSTSDQSTSDQSKTEVL